MPRRPGPGPSPHQQVPLRDGPEQTVLPEADSGCRCGASTVGGEYQGAEASPWGIIPLGRGGSGLLGTRADVPASSSGRSPQSSKALGSLPLTPLRLVKGQFWRLQFHGIPSRPAPGPRPPSARQAQGRERLSGSRQRPSACVGELRPQGIWWHSRCGQWPRGTCVPWEQGRAVT